jgi:hypothetical protein
MWKSYKQNLFKLQDLGLWICQQYVNEGRSQWPYNLRLARSNTGNVGSNPTQDMDVCVYFAFVLGSDLSTAWSPVQGVLPTVLD